MAGEKQQRPALVYPLEWEYRVIGSHEDDVRAAIARVMGPRAHVLSSARPSPQGRWVSVHVHLTVHSEAERDQLHAALVADAAVRLVM